MASFRLELLTEANGISHEHAHDATSDVYATIAIAKLIKQKTPKLFDYYFDLRNKNKVKALIDVEQMTPLVHISGMFGAVRGNTALVAPVVWHPINTNAVVVVDLSQDISPLLELSADEIRERLYTKKDELGEKLPIPLKLIHINKCPFLAISKTLLPENAERLGVNRQACLDNLECLKANKQIVDVVSDVFQQEYKFDNKANVDAMLYDGFFSFEDKKIFEKIHNATPENLGKLSLSVSDKRFKELFFRYRARNFPDSLTHDEAELWTKYRQSALLPGASDYFSRLDLFAEEQKGDEKNMKIIRSLYKYAEKLVGNLN
jgi:exodeoxyribonuclease-1